MKERLLNQLSLTRRLRQFLVLFTLLLMPLGAWADYELAIQYGTDESNYHSVSVPEDATDVLGDGTITYDSNTHVLTLNGANVTCSYNSYSFIVNNGYWDAEQELTVRLVGSNTITLGNGSSFYDGKGITFMTGEGNDGSLTIVKESGWNGILFKDGSTEITPTYNDGLTYNSSTSEITLAEDHYSLWVCGTQVTDANKDNILGDGKWSFIHDTGAWTVNKLSFSGVTIENYEGNVISSGIDVAIDANGSNTISCADGYYPFYSENGAEFEFVADFEGTITGTNRKPFSDNSEYWFRESLEGPTLYFTDTGYTIAKCTNQWEVDINNNYIYNENHADVFGDGSVSVSEADNGTTVNFTLNNANFRGPIKTESYENVVVDLTGVNYIRVIDQPDRKAFARGYAGGYILTFIGDGELRIIDKYITSADDPFTSHDYSDETHDASANFTTGGWSKEYITPTDGSDPYLRIYKAPISYDLTVAGVQVTSANAANVLGDDETPTVVFDAATNTLTLNNATINGNIVVSNVLSTLNIKVKGQNVINAGSQSAIKANIHPDHPYDNIVLSFAKDGEGDCSLQLNSDGVTVISGGFDDEHLTYTDLALVVEDESSDVSYYSNQGLCYYPDFTPITSATITSYTTYGITVNGIAVTSLNMNSILKSSPENGQISFDGDHTLTLSDGASVGQISYSGTSNLTIAFGGTCSITTEQTYAIQYVGSESARPKLTFSLTNETGSLSINGESLVIEGFSDVDFGGLNLASRSGQGVYYDSSEYGYHMAGYGGNPNNLTITTETYHPIWIYDPSLGQEASHTQLNSNKLSVAFGEGTISFDGNHTITMNNVDFNYEDNTLIVVGPGMEELTVNLVGTSTVRSGSIFLSLWATTPLTFTTNESTPGTLTGYDIVSWMDFGNGQISYQNGLNVFYDVENSYKKTISTTGTYIKIGNTEVSATGDITTSGGTAHFDASSNTLTLTNATIGSTDVSTDIQVLVDNLIIEISGTNTLYGNISYNGSNYQSSNIQINKASNVESASLKVTNVEGFTSCTWGDGLYLSAQDAQGATVDVHYEHYEGEGGSMQSYYGNNIAEVFFSTTETNAIWVAGNMSTGGNITGEGIEGTVTYNADDRILTIENAFISTSENYPSPLIVCNGDLTVNLVGEDNQVYFNGYYGTYVFKNNASTGTLTFTGDGFLGINTDYDEGTYFGLCDGFSTVDFGDLAYTINGDSKKISPLDISTPMMNVHEGKIAFITEGYLFGSTTYYKIIYADGSGNEEEVPLTNVVSNQTFDFNNYNEKITISELTGPCTVYAYTKYKEETGASAKAKLFGPAEEIQRIVYGETASLAIAPAIEDGDGIKISGIEANNLNYDSETGKVTGTAIGSTSFPVPLSYTSESGGYMPGNTIILNSENFYMDVEIVPPAPTISLEAGTYLSTHDPITITRTGLDNTTNTTIKYKWDDGTAQTYEEAIPVQNGTLTAWVEYSDGTTTVSSEEVTAEYTVNTDIATLYVAPIEDITYTGSAVTPTIVVKATEEAEASLVSGTDYTVSYKQGETAVAAAALINVATYTVVISGNGSYGGTKEVTFNIIKATPNITFAQESYSATLGEAFTSPATVDNWTVSPTASSNTSVANISEGQIVLVGVGTTMITVTYAGNDNYNSTTASYELVVSRALDIEFAGSNSWASYYATESLTVPEGLTAYVVSAVNGETGAVTVASVDYIPANKAVLLKRANDGAASGYTAAAYTSSTSTFTNLLGGSTSATAISSLNSRFVYVLFNDKFKRAISGTIPARRAYLAFGATTAPTSAPQYLTISITDGNTTAIDTLTVDDDSNDSWYTIDGLKLNGKPQHKGLYINNGKKVYINNK